MKNIKAIIGIILVFLLGAASGSIATYMLQRERVEALIKGKPEVREELIVSRLTKKLDLDAQQQLQVRSIVHENHLAMQQVRIKFRPQIQAILEQGQTRIAATLRPEQQEKFRQIIAERRKHHPPE